MSEDEDELAEGPSGWRDGERGKLVHLYVRGQALCGDDECLMGQRTTRIPACQRCVDRVMERRAR